MTDTSATDRSQREVGFQEAFSLYFRNYVQFSGRSSRGAFWYWVLWTIIISVVLSTVDYFLFGAQKGVFQGLWGLITLIPGIALNTRRLHDLNHSGWWQLLFLTVIGAILLLYWYCLPGKAGENDYGPDVEAGKL
ncbi:DUF805 domain-containing protein [Martelella endophytica]|uniref:DUF805 domain-containing protein n=1 Tax=Martelella endophytica TaxID=1486262 RepID=UPI0005F1DA21|nr:DUF805 domain-containing protein [Martelella endophytica]